MVNDEQHAVSLDSCYEQSRQSKTKLKNNEVALKALFSSNWSLKNCHVYVNFHS